PQAGKRGEPDRLDLLEPRSEPRTRKKRERGIGHELVVPHGADWQAERRDEKCAPEKEERWPIAPQAGEKDEGQAGPEPPCDAAQRAPVGKIAVGPCAGRRGHHLRADVTVPPARIRKKEEGQSRNGRGEGGASAVEKMA